MARLLPFNLFTPYYCINYTISFIYSHVVEIALVRDCFCENSNLINCLMITLLCIQFGNANLTHIITNRLFLERSKVLKVLLLGDLIYAPNMQILLLSSFSHHIVISMRYSVANQIQVTQKKERKKKKQPF